jgi:hypothetical protein
MGSGVNTVTTAFFGDAANPVADDANSILSKIFSTVKGKSK